MNCHWASGNRPGLGGSQSERPRSGRRRRAVEAWRRSRPLFRCRFGVDQRGAPVPERLFTFVSYAIGPSIGLDGPTAGSGQARDQSPLDRLAF